MGTVDFKSVGVSSTSREVTSVAPPTPIGIRTPMQVSSGDDGIFVMHYDLGDQISDNLRNLLLTNRGDRLGFYDFGADLHPLSIELGTDLGDREAASRISRAVKKFMPFIVPRTFTTQRDQTPPIARVRIRMTYDVPTLGILNRAIEAVLYVEG